MLIPFSTEVLIRRLPLGNLLIMGACILAFLAMWAGVFPLGLLDRMILSDWIPAGLIGHQFIHGGFWHLLFNMLYLWVFGNTVNEKVGNAAYAGLFLVNGVLAGCVHLLLSGEPAIGASGAINGIIGFYLVLHPINRVNCFYWFVFRAGTFDIKGYWLILFWFACDAWAAFAGVPGGIAYWAHVGGFLSGFALGFVFLKMRWARMDDYDNPTLLDYMTGQAEASYVLPKSSPARPAGLSRPAPARPPDIPSVLPPHGYTWANCPHCDRQLEIPENGIGPRLVCPSCRGEIEVDAGEP